MDNEKVYIGGKITGNPNFEAEFKEAEEREKTKGNKVMNPAILPGGFSQADYMRICFAMIDACEVIKFLPNWIKSDGAKVEKIYGEKVGKKIVYL